MKNIHVGIGLPTPQTVDIEFAFGNLPSIISQAKKDGYKVSLLYKNGVRTDSNRNHILNEFLQRDVTHILWLDVDEIYPTKIVDYLVKADKDVIGTVYYKRSHPHDPVVYVKNDRTDRPYTAVDTSQLPKEPLEVDGIGFGGMLVKREVYEALGEDKWSSYGKNFHIPTATTEKLSHDLNFCETLKSHGYKIWVHNGVTALHIAKKAIGYENYVESRPVKKKVAVICPSIDLDRANKSLKQLESRDGVDRNLFDVEYWAVEDKTRSGFVRTFKNAIDNIKADYYVYTAEDAFAGQDWLKLALSECKGLHGFNNGKWDGRLAAFGMMTNEFAHKYWHTLYHSHYIDTEITLIAKKLGVYTYNPSSLLIEVDYKKHGINPDDKELFNERKKILFADSPELQNLFS